MHIDLHKAEEYYRRAADKGEPNSQMRLAKMIIEGTNSERLENDLYTNTKVEDSIKHKEGLKTALDYIH